MATYQSAPDIGKHLLQTGHHLKAIFENLILRIGNQSKICYIQETKNHLCRRNPEPHFFEGKKPVRLDQSFYKRF